MNIPSALRSPEWARISAVTTAFKAQTSPKIAASFSVMANPLSVFRLVGAADSIDRGGAAECVRGRVHASHSSRLALITADPD